MSAESTFSDESFWKYLHGELADDRRMAFEREYAGHRDIARRLAESWALDRRLREDLALAAEAPLSDDALAEVLQSAWERETAAAAARVGSGGFPGRSHWRWTGGVVSLAAAALVMLLALLTPERERFAWDAPVGVPLVYRGAAPEHGSAADVGLLAQRCQAALHHALDTTLQRRGITLSRGLRLALRLQQLSSGAFSVALEARWRDGSPAGSWNGDYSGLEAFLRQAPASAEAIAGTLSEASAAGDGAGRSPES